MDTAEIPPNPESAEDPESGASQPATKRRDEISIRMVVEGQYQTDT